MKIEIDQNWFVSKNILRDKTETKLYEVGPII